MRISDWSSDVCSSDLVMPGSAELPEDGAPVESETWTLDHGHVVIAAITSCTNTSNPSVMLAAGLLATNAVERGIKVKPWVRSEARRVGKECVSTCRSRWSPYP